MSQGAEIVQTGEPLAPVSPGKSRWCNLVHAATGIGGIDGSAESVTCRI
jgi:hypothetical protein